MPRDESNNVAIWSIIIVTFLILVGVLFLCGQCIGDPIWEDTGPGY